MTETELIEVLLHLSIRGGLPKAATAFKIAGAVLKEPETKKRAEENALIGQPTTRSGV